ncbi:MAG: choice-of-anchor D domain-containing protein [bacterium]
MVRAKVFTFILLTIVAFFAYQTAFASTAHIRLEPADISVNINDTFTTTVYIDSNSKIGAYWFEITFDGNLIAPDPDMDPNIVVEAGKDGFLAYSNPNYSEGILPVDGIYPEGTGPGSNLEFLIIHWKALNTAGTGTIGITVFELSDPLGHYLDTNTSDANVTVYSESAPEITIQGNGITIADGDDTPDSGGGTGLGTGDDSPDGTYFGIVDVDGGTKTRTFTIRNLGISNLELEGVEITGPHADSFSVTAQPSLSIDPNHSTTFAIEFNPDESGVFTATITISNNDENENPYNFAIQGTGLKKPEQPSCTSPENLKDNEGFEPVLIASGFSDQDQGDTHRASQWQIFLSGQTEEDPPIYDLTIGPEQKDLDPNTSFTKTQILWGILKKSTSYQWRVRYQDAMGQLWSEWSDFSTFTTEDSDPEFEDQQVDTPSGFDDPNMKGAVRGAISSENTGHATVIFACEKEKLAVKSINPENLPAEGRPGDFPIGVFSFRIEDLSPGETVLISFYIPGYYEGGKWWKFDNHSGWHEHKDATFTYKPATAHTLVEVTVQDGGDGDGDRVSNGTIVDPGGPTPPSMVTVLGGGGGGGCFISTLFLR